MSSYKELHPKCPECDGVCDNVFIPTVPYISFKDGPSGSWPGKGNRFKQYRAKQAELAQKRQNERYGISKEALPNYKGEETGTWAEAQQLALKDKGIESAATYTAKVAEENSKKIK